MIDHMVAVSFKRILCDQLAKYLHMPSKEIVELVSKMDGWKIEDEYVVLPSNADNEPNGVAPESKGRGRASRRSAQSPRPDAVSV